MEDTSFKLKEQAQVICTELSSQGEQSLFLSVNPANQTSTFLGSHNGMVFLQTRMDIIEQFYKFCSGQELTVDGLKKDVATMTDVSEKIESTSQNQKLDIQFKSTSRNAKDDVQEEKDNNEPKVVPSKAGEDLKSGEPSGGSKDMQEEQLSLSENADLLDSDHFSENDTTVGNIFVSDEKGKLDSFSSKSGNSDNGEKAQDGGMSKENSEKEPSSWKERLIRKRKPTAAFLEAESQRIEKNWNKANSASPKQKETKKSKSKISKLKSVEERTFDIYTSGKKIFQGVMAIKDYSEQEIVPNSKDKFLVEGSKEKGFFINFQDLSNDEIKPIERSKTKVKKPVTPKTPNGEPKTYICTYCGKVCKTKTWLRRHTLMHTGERPLVCKICGKTYRQYGHLLKHKISHNPEYRPYVCEVCGKTFSYLDSLKSHSKLHQDLPPCQCPDCGKMFARKELLRQHLVFKKSGKDHMCEICGHAFRQKDSLKKHLLTHQENRVPEFECPHCNKKFFRKHTFKTHVNNHLGIHRYVCDCCNIVFSSANTLSKHKRRKAGLLGGSKSKAVKKVVSKNKQIQQLQNLPIKVALDSNMVNVEQQYDTGDIYPITNGSEIIYVIDTSAISEQTTVISSS